MTSVNVMPGRPSSPIVSLPTFWKETPKVILPIIEPKLYVSGKISLCVECLEKYLLHGNSDVEAFDIPELEVRPGMMEPLTVSDPLPPQLCECDELGSICGLCKIVMDKIVSSTASSSSCSCFEDWRWNHASEFAQLQWFCCFITSSPVDLEAANNFRAFGWIFLSLSCHTQSYLRQIHWIGSLFLEEAGGDT